MKKVAKFGLIFILLLLIMSLGVFVYYFSSTINYRLDKNKLVNAQNAIEFYDSDGEIISSFSNDTKVVKLSELNDYTFNAFISVEDKRFYSHNGIDYKGLSRALIKNITTFSFKEGGSTISQQLIKNTHLTNKKTIKRKFIEFKLTKQLERNFSKEEILEKYLNTIYFGHNLYGIESASNYYFNKSAKDLDVAESAFLAGIIKAPNTYSITNSYEKCVERRNLVLSLMCEQGYISKKTYNSEITKPILVKNERINNDYYTLCQIELNQILSENPYVFNNCKVYTYFNKDINKILTNEVINNDDNIDKNAIILSPNNKVLAYRSTCTLLKRQLGSTIKPLAVYAPAIEENLIHSASIILDEKTDFNGYTPSNYNDKYYGYISAKTALSKSLNVPAVKILNSLGIDKSKIYLDKLSLNIDANKNGLGLALGGTNETFTIKDVVSAYSVFNNKGNYSAPTTISHIVNADNEVVYRDKNISKSVFSEETAYLISDMLENAVNDGTAKRLKGLNANIYAKTGTNGNENGNFDAYTISYTKDYTIGVWCGKSDNSLMNNSITGGNLPAEISAYIWNGIYLTKTNTKISKPDTIVELALDKSEYNNNHRLVLADDIAPHQEKIFALFNSKTINLEQNDDYSNPKSKNISAKLENGNIKIYFDKNNFINYKIYICDKFGKELVLDTISIKENYFYDNKIKSNTEYTYTVLPYYKYKDKFYYGKEQQIISIKTDKIEVPDEWLDFIDDIFN